MLKLTVQDKDISLLQVGDEVFVSLTDIVKNEDGDDHIRNWMRNRNTLEFLGLWEQINNPDFKGVEFDTFRKEAGLNSFNMTPRKWIDLLTQRVLYQKLEELEAELLLTKILL